MKELIHLLPDAIANQIAAGEVVQRPASVVKELMENAIDAQATTVKLIIEDGGKKSIQVVDDGYGMSETDLRMAFERHATSKINEVDDLYQLKTLGFRGEALASIAAVAVVETKTKQEDEELGYQLVVEGSEVKKHEACTTQTGTSITVKNLFYNTPARKNFLKSYNVEYRHIMEEFLRVALVNSNKTLIFKNGQEVVYHLKTASIRKRIVQVLGKKYEDGLVPIEEQTSLVHIHGYISKPDFARKTRGSQYFFVNNRFIRSGYLNHAVLKAFESLLPEGYYPLYFIYLDMDPTKIDVNVHPTKTEIKFEDEKSIYAILKAAIKKALSQNHIAPALDFDKEEIPAPFYDPSSKEGDKMKVNTGGAPVSAHQAQGENWQPTRQQKAGKSDWEELYKVLQHTEAEQSKNGEQEEQSELFEEETEEVTGQEPVQIQKKYLLTSIKSGMMIIHQHYAHQRILYEKYLKRLEASQGASQQQLFPEVIELPYADYQLFKKILPDIRGLGFQLEDFGKSAFILNGKPIDVQVDQVQGFFEQMLEDYKHNTQVSKIGSRESLARSLAGNTAMKAGKTLNGEEMKMLIDQLFACEMPYYTASGKPVFVTISNDELDKKFEQIKR